MDPEKSRVQVAHPFGPISHYFAANTQTIRRLGRDLDEDRPDLVRQLLAWPSFDPRPQVGRRRRGSAVAVDLLEPIKVIWHVFSWEHKNFRR